ncbi:MAG: hypothetical protein EH225_05425, partial [Calditrichaeota bacterium]
DTRLKRKVAIKFLPPSVAANEEIRERFRIEARAAAALNHPNITQIYAFEESGDFRGDREMFIVMEYIEGRELKELISNSSSPFTSGSLSPLRRGERGDVLTIAEIIDYALQIAEGLKAAHQKGIVHRDIKSSNIMITDDGRVKIMDFGLARVGQGIHLTKEQSTLGTTAYMSPEQIRGDTVDHRTDIWSWGVVLYEMVTGHLPFKGEYEQAVIYSILNEEPKFQSTIKSGFPDGIENIIRSCLIKQVDQRYQSMDDLIYSLRNMNGNLTSEKSSFNTDRSDRLKKKTHYIWFAVAALLAVVLLFIILNNESASTDRLSSIAVLPMDNISGDQDQEYFADGMTESFISSLAQISSLRVISRTSIMKYKNVHKPIREIARELDVEAILEGSVYQDKQRVRITVQLVDALRDQNLWAENYNRELEDVLSIQSEVALAVARQIKITLTPEEEKRFARTYSVNPAAHEAYLKGEYNVQQFTMGTGTLDQLKKGIQYYQHAISLDPGWAKAHTGLAYAYHWLASAGNEEEYYPLSKASALRAIDLDETLSGPHGSLAFVLHNYDWNWERAAAEYRRANQLNPNGFAWGIAIFLLSAGQYEDAVTWYKRAELRDPLSTLLKSQLGWAYINAGRYDDAIQKLKSTLELNPKSSQSRSNLAEAYLRKKMYEKAIEELKMITDSSNSPWFLAQLGYAYALAGRKKDARKILEQLEERKIDDFVVTLMELYVVLGEIDKALSILSEAYEKKDREILYIKNSFVYDDLKEKPSFQKILKGIGFPQEKIIIESYN